VKITKLLFASIIALAPSVAIAQNQLPQVISVGDGDTVRIAINGKPETVRLGCIDAPEKTQKPYGPSATQRLRQLLPKGQAVQVRQIERDRYGRLVGELFLGNQSVNLQMVRDGQAVVYTQYLDNCAVTKDEYLKAEAQAKKKRLGFWNQNNPIMPWNYRASRRRGN
jgi:micrococcal nuclease